MNKVYGGTVRQHDQSSMCLSCRHAHIITTTNDQRIFCGFLPDDRTPPQPVVQCTYYDNKAQPTRQDYERTAWILNTSRDGRVIGFVNPRQWKIIKKKREKEEETTYEDE